MSFFRRLRLTPTPGGQNGGAFTPGGVRLFKGNLLAAQDRGGRPTQASPMFTFNPTPKIVDSSEWIPPPDVTQLKPAAPVAKEPLWSAFVTSNPQRRALGFPSFFKGAK